MAARPAHVLSRYAALLPLAGKAPAHFPTPACLTDRREGNRYKPLVEWAAYDAHKTSAQRRRSHIRHLEQSRAVAGRNLVLDMSGFSSCDRAHMKGIRQLQGRPIQTHRSSHACCLPAAMDPREDHRESAARALRELVLLQRARAQQQAMAAAAGPGGSGGAPAGPRPSLADQPEFMLAFLVYVLAHHPDFPQVCG